jgi:hypothetical protein
MGQGADPQPIGRLPLIGVLGQQIDLAAQLVEALLRLRVFAQIFLDFALLVGVESPEQVADQVFVHKL